MKSPLLRVRLLGNIARLRLKAGDVRGAAAIVREYMALSSNGEASVWRPELLAIAAQVAYQQHDYPRADTLITERFAGVDPTTTTLTFREAHQTAYETYRARGKTELALVHLAALKRLDDKATALATSNNTALMAARFDFANQELKITRLKYDEGQRAIAYERARAKTQRSIFLGSTAATAIVIGLLVFALVTSRRARLKVAAANDDLAVTNAALGKALAAKTEFLATTSHEIRTPLNGILGMTQVMLADAELPPATRERVTLVHSAGITMRALVDDILDVAKMETGNLTLESAPFDLRATITDAARLWEEQARGRGLVFTVALDGAPGRIEGDSARVRQIVFNLLSNALKFTSEGQIALSATVHGDCYAIAVSDSGIGIPADKREEIFESFRQADSATTRRFGGTGLGLSICRNLARAMGGDIAVDSAPGAGSVFTVTLPLVAAPEAPVQPCADAVAAGEGPVVLIVDRNPITRAMFRTLLTPHCGAIAFAGSLDEATMCIAAGGTAQVLVDDATVRGEGDVHAALAALADAARARDARVTLLWPVSAPAERAELMATGVDRVVAKPVTGAALVSAMFAEDAIATDSTDDHGNALVSRAA